MELEFNDPDPQVFFQTERLRLRLRILRNNIANLEKFVDLEEWIYLRLATGRRWTKQMEALDSRLEKTRSRIKWLRCEEKEIKSVLAGYPEIYRDLLADILDSADRKIRDC